MSIEDASRCVEGSIELYIELYIEDVEARTRASISGKWNHAMTSGDGVAAFWEQ